MVVDQIEINMLQAKNRLVRLLKRAHVSRMNCWLVSRVRTTYLARFDRQQVIEDVRCPVIESQEPR